MSGSKIQLSKDELDLVKNSDWILTKNRVIRKFEEGLGSLSEQMREYIGEREYYSDAFLKSSGPRISRGEKYEGLPWLVLDYPRIFGKQDIFAIRTFFWWGRHCSVSIHCRGHFLPTLMEGILRQKEAFEKDFYLAIDGDEWVHDLEAAPWKPFAPQMVENPEFIRLGKITPLAQWNIMEEDLFDSFKTLINLIELKPESLSDRQMNS